MNIQKKDNQLIINGKILRFKNAVDTVIAFPKYCVVLLLDDDIPDSNVEAIDYDGNRVWNISQVIKLPYAEAYISLSKESETAFSVVSYSGVKFVIDTMTQSVSGRSITK